MAPCDLSHIWFSSSSAIEFIQILKILSRYTYKPVCSIFSRVFGRLYVNNTAITNISAPRLLVKRISMLWAGKDKQFDLLKAFDNAYILSISKILLLFHIKRLVMHCLTHQTIGKPLY